MVKKLEEAVANKYSVENVLNGLLEISGQLNEEDLQRFNDMLMKIYGVFENRLQNNYKNQ